MPWSIWVKKYNKKIIKIKKGYIYKNGFEVEKNHEIAIKYF